jgi:hypothetical protein
MLQYPSGEDNSRSAAHKIFPYYCEQKSRIAYIFLSRMKAAHTYAPQILNIKLFTDNPY